MDPRELARAVISATEAGQDIKRLAFALAKGEFPTMGGFLQQPWNDPKMIWPATRRTLVAVTDPSVREFHLEIGKGGGKSAISTWVLAFSIGELLAMDDPHSFFGLAGGKPIACVTCSVSEIQGRRNIFAGLRTLVQGNPFFKDRAKIGATTIDFDDGKVLALCGHSSSEGMEGYDVYCAILDEANKHKDAAGKSNAKALFEMFVSSAESRFPDHYRVGTVSSSRSADDFQRKAIEEIQARGKRVIVPGFEIEPEPDVEIPEGPVPPSKESFPVTVHRDGGRLGMIGPVWLFNPKATYQHFVYRFNVNPMAALRDQASSPQKDGEVVRVYADVNRLRSMASDRPHPLGPNREFTPNLRPRMANYYIHLDLAESKDAAGFAMVHRPPRGGVYVDLMLEDRPDEQHRVHISGFLNLIQQLRHRGFNIVQVSTDAWGSSQFRQDLEGMGIKTDKRSVDRTLTPHETLFELLHSPGAIDIYDYPPFWGNLEHLIYVKNGKKIDHDASGGKDVADALAGAIDACIEKEGPIMPQEITGLLGPPSEDHEKVDERDEGDYDDFAFYDAEDPVTPEDAPDVLDEEDG